jgi:hypothetical protein
MPLSAVLLERGLGREPAGVRDCFILTPLGIFMLADIIVRLPGIGGCLRDLGIPLSPG